MRTRRTEGTRRNDVVQRNSSTTKAVRKRIIEDSIKESSTRLTRKKLKEKEAQIKRITDREIRLLRRNKDISISVSTSANDGDSSKVQDDQKGQLADDASSEAPMEGTDVVKSPANCSNKRKITQRREQIASKAALESIGKIA